MVYQVKTENLYGKTAWVPSVEVAKYVRAILKEKFSGRKFSVRKDQSTGTIRIDVDVSGLGSDGAQSLVREVQNEIGFLHGEGFDGMIDMRYSRTHYLLPNGQIIFGGTEGTGNSGGVYERQEIAAPEGAIPVRLANDFIFVQRAY